MDLSAFPDDQYDITLLLDPLYRLYSEEDKRQALREAIRVTKPGGVIFAAYVISDGCLLDEWFKRRNIDVRISCNTAALYSIGWLRLIRARSGGRDGSRRIPIVFKIPLCDL